MKKNAVALQRAVVTRRRGGGNHHSNLVQYLCRRRAAVVAFQCLLIAAKMRWQSKVGTTAHDFEICRWLPILTPLHLHQRLPMYILQLSDCAKCRLLEACKVEIKQSLFPTHYASSFILPAGSFAYERSHCVLG